MTDTNTDINTLVNCVTHSCISGSSYLWNYWSFLPQNVTPTFDINNYYETSPIYNKCVSQNTAIQAVMSIILVILLLLILYKTFPRPGKSHYLPFFQLGGKQVDWSYGYNANLL
jgi:hypothetical protein